MKHLLLCLCLCSVVRYTSGQDSLRMHLRWQAPAPPGASSLLIDAEGNVLVLCRETGQLYKYLAVTAYDSVISIGGRASRVEGFLEPVQLAQKNRQQLYVLDEAQRRIVLLNPNLRVAGMLDFADLAGEAVPDDVWPQRFDTGPSGELFVLDRFSNTVIKLNAFQEVENVFGGLDAAEGSLRHPTDILVSEDNRVLVADSMAGLIKLYNLFGIYQQEIRPAPGFRWTGITLWDRQLLLYHQDRLWIGSLLEGRGRYFMLPGQPYMRCLAARRDQLAVLTENEIRLYSTLP